MKWIVFIAFVFLYGVASAQPAPRPNLPGPDRDRWDQQWRPHPGHVRYPRNCREWRREVRWHPRLRLPYYCRYDERRFDGPPGGPPVGPPRPGPR